MKGFFQGIALTVAIGAFGFAGFAQAKSIQMQDGRWLDTETGLTGESQAEVTSDATSSAPLAMIEASPSIGLRDAVTRARVLLQEHLDATRPKKPKTVASKNAWVDVTLAVWNSGTGEIKLVSAKKDGNSLKESDPDLEVAVSRTNGINSQYAVDDGSGKIFVVGVEYPILTEKVISKHKKVYTLNDVLYVPYSDKLQVPEMVAWGAQTLDGYVSDVYGQLREQGIMSRAMPGRLLADVIDPNLVKSIVFIEHAGNGVTVNDPKGVTDAIKVVLAANQGNAYAYSVSVAGARGLVQFIPSTYKLMTRRNDLGLIKDFVAGMTDPHNAIKAEVAYLDAELANMPADIRALADTDMPKLDTYLAAAYNGGGGRVHKAIAAFGESWADSHSSELAALQDRYDTLFSQAASLKKKILAENDPKIWKPMQAKLTGVRAERAAVQAQITKLKSSSLHSETAWYVKKLKAVLPIVSPSSTTLAAL